MTGSGKSCLNPTLTLVACVLASGLAFIDGSVVNVGLPAIGHGLDADATGLQWLVDGYLLPLSALLLLGGSLGDRLGRRRVLVLGVTLFGVASAACAVAPELAVLIAARILQGVGAALLMPSSLAILGETFQGEARGWAIGIWAAAGAATGAAGPVLGGWLIDAISWRMIFFINIPLAGAVVFLAWRYVREDADGHRPPLDLAGAVLASLGLGALTWGLVDGTGGSGWTMPAGLGFAAGVALLGAFVAWEGRKGQAAMMPLSLFGSRGFVGLTLLTLLLYGALGGLLVLLPYVLIEAGGYTSVTAGVALLPLPAILALASPLTGGIAGRIGARPLLVMGPLIVAAGLLLMVRVAAEANYWTTVLPALAVISVGLACAVAPLTTAVLASVDADHTGSASGLNNAVARTGGLIATALLGRVLAARGSSLIEYFHAAVIAAAVACVAAAASAALTDRKTGPHGNSGSQTATTRP